ncbi:MAG: VTT domain-containing protein [Proteocatella sp.]
MYIKNKKQMIYGLLLLTLFVIASVYVAYRCYPLFRELSVNPQKMMEFKKWVESYGIWGGFLLSLSGMFIGSMIVFLLVRAFKYRFISLFMNEKKLEEYKFLKDSPKLEAILSVLFLIPGAPKDTLVYYAGLTNISIRKFIFIVVFMRIPSMLFSTLIGSNLGVGNIKTSIWILIAVSIVGIAGLIYNKIYINKMA